MLFLDRRGIQLAVGHSDATDDQHRHGGQIADQGDARNEYRVKAEGVPVRKLIGKLQRGKLTKVVRPKRGSK